MYTKEYKGAANVAEFVAGNHDSLLQRIVSWQQAVYTLRGVSDVAARVSGQHFSPDAEDRILGCGAKASRGLVPRRGRLYSG